MRRKMSKAEKLADQRIETAYRRACSGIQIDILDISKVFTVGHKAIAEGADNAALESALLAFVNTIRKN